MLFGRPAKLRMFKTIYWRLSWRCYRWSFMRKGPLSFSCMIIASLAPKVDVALPRERRLLKDVRPEFCQRLLAFIPFHPLTHVLPMIDSVGEVTTWTLSQFESMCDHVHYLKWTFRKDYWLSRIAMSDIESTTDCPSCTTRTPGLAR